VENDLSLNAQVYDIYGKLWDDGTKQTCIDRSVELNKNIKFLEKELREIFKE
jgi:predicted heme/steroid binding protein